MLQMRKTAYCGIPAFLHRLGSQRRQALLRNKKICYRYRICVGGYNETGKKEKDQIKYGLSVYTAGSIICWMLFYQFNYFYYLSEFL